MKRPVCLKVVVAGNLVSNWSHKNPDVCGVLVQKCHFGFLGLKIWGMLTGREKVNLGSLLSLSGMKRPVRLKVVFLHSFNVFFQK